MSKVWWVSGDEKNNQLKAAKKNKCLGKLANAVKFKLTVKGQDEGFQGTRPHVMFRAFMSTMKPFKSSNK